MILGKTELYNLAMDTRMMMDGWMDRFGFTGITIPARESPCLYVFVNCCWTTLMLEYSKGSR